MGEAIAGFVVSMDNTLLIYVVSLSKFELFSS